MKGKRLVAVVLAAVVLVGLGGCGIVLQSIPESSAVSSEPSSSVETSSSATYVPQDRFEDANIINTDFTREKLAKSPLSGVLSDTDAFARRFVYTSFYSLFPISVKPVAYKDKPLLEFLLLKDQEVQRFYVKTYLVQSKSKIPLEGLITDGEGLYSYKLQLVGEYRSDFYDFFVVLGFVTSQTNQITTAEDLAEFLSVIPEYQSLQCPPKSTVPETGWFGEGPLINVAYTRASLSENPVTSSDYYHPTIMDWIELYVKGNYNSSAYDTAYSEKFYTLETMSGKKEYFATIFCETNFQSDVVPEGFEIAKSSYQLNFQMVIKTGKNYYTEPYRLIGFVTNQERQIFEPRELYDFMKGVPGYQGTDFIEPEPYKLLQLDPLGYDFTEKKVDDASGLSVVNLRSLTEGLKVDDFTFFPGDLLAVLAVNPEVQNEKVLMVYKAEELRLLYQKTFSYPAGDYPTGGHVEFDNINGTPVLEHKLGEDNFKYFVPSQTGVSEISKPIARYRLSDTASIVDEKNCLYLEQNGVQKLLLEGIYEEDSTDWENYNFYCRISDTRFIYEKYGYEWYDECGIYDIETGEKTVFTHENAPLLNIVTYTDGKAILVADDWSDYDSYGPYLYNELTGELVDLDFLDIIPDESAIRPRFCLFGNTLAIFIEDNPFTTFSLYDVSSRLEIMHLNLFYARGYARNYSYYSNGLNATENYIWFNSTSEFPTDYLLRIPIKR